jgi:ABC-type uncharacterized transport system YnjBCD permease subunit
MWVATIIVAWFALSALFAVGWGRWQRRMERFDGDSRNQ